MREYFYVSLFFILHNGISYTQKFFEVETVDQAEIKVFYVMDDNECDLKVCFVYEAKDITKVGLWMEVATADEADIKIIFVDDPGQANLKICVGDSPDQAGWLNPAKSSVLK